MSHSSANASEILSLIARAFEDVPRPNTSLRQFHLTDTRGMSGTITNVEWQKAGSARSDRHWQDITSNEIGECGVVLAHMQAQEYRYYLPAYMACAIRQMGLPPWESDVVDMVVFSLSPSTDDPASRQYVLAQYSQLTQHQRQAVVEFLRFVADNTTNEIKAAAMEALDQHWTPDVVKDGFPKQVLVIPT